MLLPAAPIGQHKTARRGKHTLLLPSVFWADLLIIVLHFGTKRDSETILGICHLPVSM